MVQKKRLPGTWAPGTSGNPEGGRLNKANKIRTALLSHAPAILLKMAELAKAGDAVAARVILDRCLPAMRPAEPDIALAIPKGASLSDIARLVMQAIATGQLDTAQGAAVLGGLASTAKIVEVDEVLARLDALESAPAKPKRLGRG